MSASDVVSIALAEVGYLEKKSAAYLDDKTANAGSANYNKYARDIWPSLQAQPWCDLFVSWCAKKAGELDAVGKYAYCPAHVNFFKSKGRWYSRGSTTPQPGDIIFFQSGGEACHVGIVEYAASGYVHTIEGNASGASGLTPNGGGVVRKSYSLGSSYIMGYGRPAYKAANAETGTAAKPVSAGKTEKIFYPWRAYKNGSTVEPVYKDTDFATMTGSLDPGESCYCLGVYGGAYLVCYKVGGYSDRWAVGYVKYAGGIS